MVRILPPPPVLPPTPVFSALIAGDRVVRVYDPGRFATRALTFRDVGAINRFDHHRTTTPATLIDVARGYWRDPDRAISYFGRTLSCCLVEVFGDTRTIERQPWEMALVEISAPLTLLDLRDHRAMRAGTVEALSKTDNRALSQSWSRYFYEQPAIYALVDGLHFHGAHNNEECVALFERGAASLRCTSAWVRPLSDPALDALIEETALKHNMLVI